MTGRLQLYYFVISETKLDPNFPSAQIHIGDSEIRNITVEIKVSGLIELVKKGIITKTKNCRELSSLTFLLKDLQILKQISARQSALNNHI